MAHSIDNTPNTSLPFEVATSYNADIFSSGTGLHGGGDAGFGSLFRRDVATDAVMYRPFRNALDTLIQLTGDFDVSKQSVYEWFENDVMLDDEATVLADGDNASQVTGTTYTAAQTALLPVSNDDADIFRVGDVIRYNSGGDYVYAYITAISDDSASAGGAGVDLTIEAFDENGTDRDVGASSSGNVIHRLHSLRGSDRNYDVQPRGSIPKAKYTYLNNITHDARMGKRFMTEDHYLDLVNNTENKLFEELKRSREIQALYGYKGKIELSNGDIVYSSPGLYDEISGFNKQSSGMTTTGDFDATKFKNAIYEFIEHNFGGESGGPETRTMFISGKFASYLSRAFVDERRFYETEYIAGVRAMRWEHNLGNIDFIYLPILDYKHPLVGGSLKEGAGKAVGMLCPVEECVKRLVKEGEGPTTQTFYEKGGDVEQNMRVTSSEGLAVRLVQYCGVLEES